MQALAAGSLRPAGQSFSSSSRGRAKARGCPAEFPAAVHVSRALTITPGALSVLRLDPFRGNKASCRTLSVQAGLQPAEVWLARYGGALSRTRRPLFLYSCSETLARLDDLPSVFSAKSRYRNAMSIAGSNFREDEPTAAAIGHGRGIRRRTLRSPRLAPALRHWPIDAQGRELRAVSAAQAAW